MRKKILRESGLILTQSNDKRIQVEIVVKDGSDWPQVYDYQREAISIYFHFLAPLHPKTKRELLKLLKDQSKNGSF